MNFNYLRFAFIEGWLEVYRAARAWVKGYYHLVWDYLECEGSSVAEWSKTQRDNWIDVEQRDRVKILRDPVANLYWAYYAPLELLEPGETLTEVRTIARIINEGMEELVIHAIYDAGRELANRLEEQKDYENWGL